MAMATAARRRLPRLDGRHSSPTLSSIAFSRSAGNARRAGRSERVRRLSSAANDSQDPPHRLPRVVGAETVFENPWVRLKTIRFLDRRGRERQWTGLERTTTYPVPPPSLSDVSSNTSDGREEAADEVCDAVVVFPFLTKRGAPTRVVLIRQFRPSVGEWVLELPAGLIDSDEAPEVAAARELREETGFESPHVLHVGPPMVNDQGITNGKSRLLLVHVREEEQPAQRQQQLEEDEMIDVVLAPLDGLVPWLMARKHREGDAIDARLYAYALGLQALPPGLIEQ